MSYTGKAIDLSKYGKKKEVELASEKVELAKEFVQIKKEAQSIYLDARTQAREDLMNLKDALDKGDKKLISLENEMSSEIKRIEATAKEIGIDIYSTKVGSNIKEAKAELNEYKKSFSKAISQAKGLKI